MEIIELKNIIADIDNFYGKPLSLLFKPFINENIFSFIKDGFLVIFNVYTNPKIKKIDISDILQYKSLSFDKYFNLKNELDKVYCDLSLINLKKEIFKSLSGPSKKNELRLNMSNYCSLRCKYCFQKEKNTHRLSLEQCYDQIDKFLEETSRDSTISVTMNMTSEPFLDFDSLRKVYNYLQEKSLASFIKTLKKKDIYNFLNITTDDEYNEILLKKDYYKSCFKNMDRRFISDSLEDKLKNISFSKDEEFIKNTNLEVIYTSMSAQKNIYYFFINTNGTIRPNKQQLQFLKKLYSQSHLGLSLDGDKKSSTDRCYKNGKTSYNEVMKNIKFLRKNGIQLRINCTLTEDHNDILKLIKFFEKHKLYNLGFNLKKGVYSKSLVENIDKAFDAYYNGKIKSLYNLDSFFRFIETNEIACKNCNGDCRKTIGYDNEIYYCEYFIEKQQKNVVTTNVANRKPCNNCPFNYVCGGTCIALTNGTTEIHEGSCKLRKEIIKRSIFCLS